MATAVAAGGLADAAATTVMEYFEGAASHVMNDPD